MKILVMGGTRYFGKRLVKSLIEDDHEVTVLSRGKSPDSFGDRVERIHCDRTDPEWLGRSVKGKAWDVIVDQICMNAKDARSACEIFAGHTNFYVFTSSQSVYPAGADLREADYDPKAHHFSDLADDKIDYAEGKRQAEAVFSTNASFKVASIRLPIVLGQDDYTRRLAFHVECVRNGEAIYFPNIHAKISFIRAEDAAKSIYQILELRLAGPMNVAAPTPIRLRELMDIIEIVTGKTAVLAKGPDLSKQSYFGIDRDWFMNVERAAAHGIRPLDLNLWLRTLIEYCFTTRAEDL